MSNKKTAQSNLTAKTCPLDRARRLRLCAEATVDDRTVQAIYAGRTVRSTTRLRIEEAAKKLGYPPPPIVAASRRRE